jgi:UDPglucose 6-dehydrogenase
MNVAVVGTGYVGLVTGAVFADLGNDVICVDKLPEKVEMLNKSIMPIYEPGLEEMVVRNKNDGRLVFTTDLDKAVKESEVIFICVGTPPKANGESDLAQVSEVAEEIGNALDHYIVVVNKSTVPVGTGDLVRNIIEKTKKQDTPFDVVSNPEFLREGSAISDTLYPDRIVIGAPNQHVAMKLLELYAPLERPMLITDVYSAEIIKYASNAFLATKISFINMIADLCEKTHADITHVIKGMGFDSRIGKAFLQAGLGYGGSCFPKDTLALIYTASKNGEDMKILKSVVETNEERVKRFVGRMSDALGGIEGKTFAVLGLAFKPNTDDIRFAKALDIIQLLLAQKAKVKAYDPIAMENTKKVMPQIQYCESSYQAAEGSDAIVIVTEWNEFKLLNLQKVKDIMKTPMIFDGRNIYDPDRMKSIGFQYYSIGR